MRTLLRTFLCFVLTIYLNSVYAQADTSHLCDITFSGKVLDGETHEPLPGAVIIIGDSGKSVLSNNHGNFVFEHLCKGNYRIAINFYGYKGLSLDLFLEKDFHKEFVLHSDTCALPSVVIEAVSPNNQSVQPVLQLAGEDLNRTRGVPLGEALKTLPGVTALQTGPTVFKPVIQGMYGNRVLVMNNGVRMEGQQWGAEHAPEVDPYLASRISVIKGASSVRYGSDALGGVVLVDPRILRSEPGVGGELNFAGMSNNRAGVASGIVDFAPAKITGLSTRVQGTYRRAGNSKTPDYYLDNTGVKEYNYSAALGYNKEKFGTEIFYSKFNTRIGIYSGSHIEDSADVQQIVSGELKPVTSGFSYSIRRPYQQIAHEMVKWSGYWHMNKDVTLEYILARQLNYRAEYDNEEDSHEEEGPQTTFKLATSNASLVLDHRLSEELHGDAGVQFMHQVNTVGGTEEAFIPDFKSDAVGFFIIERWKRKRWEWEGGLRYDARWVRAFVYENNLEQTPQFFFGNASGTLGTIVRLSDHWNLRANAGTGFRPPSVSELFSNGLHHGSARIEEGNRQLKSEKALNATMVAEFTFRKFYGSITAYQNYIHDYIYLAPIMNYDSLTGTLVPQLQNTRGGAFPLFQYRQINASFTGLDLTFNDSLSKNFILSTRASLLRAYNQSSDSYLILTPPASAEYGIKYSFTLSPGIQRTYIKLSHLLVARKSKVPSYEDLKLPPPGYMLFNLEAGFGFKAGKQSMNVLFTVSNLLNHRYRDYLDRFRYFNDAVGRNFVIRLNIPFDYTKKKSSS